MPNQSKPGDNDYHSHNQTNQTNQMEPPEICCYLRPRIAPLPSRLIFICKLVVDGLVLISLLTPIVVLFSYGKPYQRGFYCDDDSIRYPYLDSTISSNLLFAYSTSIPILVICLNEMLILRTLMAGHNASNDYLLRNYCWQAYTQLMPFAFACLSSQLITDIAKYSIGRLRPHFIDVCRPIINGVKLDRFSNCSSPETYYINFECSTLGNWSKIKDARLSFMSGHSSFCAVALMYLVIYIQMRVKWRSLGLLKPLFQYLLICLILFTGFSRISDYKHHWSDVLMGLIQGTTTALLCAFFVSDLYRPQNYLLLSKGGDSFDPPTPPTTTSPPPPSNRESGV